jgi:phosphohistidine phosphatase
MRELVHSGAIPFRRVADRWEYLLVTSRQGNWIFPKGLVEHGVTPQETALKECAEEAGVRGEILADSIGTYEDRKWQHPCRVHMYLLRFTEEVEWEEGGIRRRVWLGYDDAFARLRKPELRRLLEVARQRLEQLEAIASEGG